MIFKILIFPEEAMSSSSSSEDHLSLILSAFPSLTPDEASNLIVMQNSLHNDYRVTKSSKCKQKTKSPEKIVSQSQVCKLHLSF